jgi:hypothetical protein
LFWEVDTSGLEVHKVCIETSFYLIYVFFINRIYVCIDAKDEAPGKLVLHFKKVLQKMREDKWDYYIPDKISGLSKFDVKSLATHRGFETDCFTFWPGPKLLHRSITASFESIRRLFYQHKCAVTSPKSFPSTFVSNPTDAKDQLVNTFVSLAAKKRGRKKRKTATKDKKSPEVFDDILLEGVTPRRVVALYFKWQGYDAKDWSWQALSDQPGELQEWWVEQIEDRYPMMIPADYRIPLGLRRNKSFYRQW